MPKPTDVTVKIDASEAIKELKTYLESFKTYIERAEDAISRLEALSK
jgi:prefoldin subunit 5